MAEILSKQEAKKIWIHAQRLDTRTPFGKGPKATTKAIEHLGYVQIDTINVIERSHHHILFSRIPDYKRSHLHQAQTLDKTVFEYWTHALAYVPVRDYRYFMADMKRREKNPPSWYGHVSKPEMQKVLRLIKDQGALSIRDIDDEEELEKTHPWASKKPSKRVLQLGFYTGKLVISERVGMLKKYELAERHFQWAEKPKAASEKEVHEYLVDRALRAQGLVSIESICHLEKKAVKTAVHKVIEARVKKGLLLPVEVKGLEKTRLWMTPEQLEEQHEPEDSLVHILSPFDPLTIQRKRLQAFFDYEHRFEAYLPKEKRRFGYFALPVLLEDQIVAAMDLKTDRENQKLVLQKWSWIGKYKSAVNKNRIEEELHRFEKFQLGKN